MCVCVCVCVCVLCCIVCVCWCCLVSKSWQILLQPHGLYPPSSPVHWISQARIPEWVVNSFSRGSSWPRDRTHVSCIGRWIPYHWAFREAQYDVHTHTHTHTRNMMYTHTHARARTNEHMLKNLLLGQMGKKWEVCFLLSECHSLEATTVLQSPGGDHHDFKYFTWGYLLTWSALMTCLLTSCLRGDDLSPPHTVLLGGMSDRSILQMKLLSPQQSCAFRDPQLGNGELPSTVSLAVCLHSLISLHQDLYPGLASLNWVVTAPSHLGSVQVFMSPCLTKRPCLNAFPQVNFWHSDQCNMINGTSGQMWAPFMTPESSLEFYSPEACR